VLDAHPLLGLAADLDRRDGEIAATLDRVLGLDGRAEAIRARATRLHELLQAMPGERAALARSEAEARDARSQASAGVADAEHELARLASARREDEDARAVAERRLDRARETDAESAARVERLTAEQATLAAAEAAARVEADALLAAAREVAAQIDEIPRVSDTGRGAPAADLRGLTDWASRVHTALFVVRAQLEGERDRVVREANELGGAVLGEQLGGANVALVRTRLEEALGQ
jgi:chromosome segregation ATPase